MNESQYLSGDSLYKSGSSKTDFRQNIYVILAGVSGVTRDYEWRNLKAFFP
jgi:hypothetical protein